MEPFANRATLYHLTGAVYCDLAGLCKPIQCFTGVNIVAFRCFKGAYQRYSKFNYSESGPKYFTKSIDWFIARYNFGYGAGNPGRHLDYWPGLIKFAGFDI